MGENKKNTNNIPAINGIKGITAVLIASVWHYQHLAGSGGVSVL